MSLFHIQPILTLQTGCQNLTPPFICSGQNVTSKYRKRHQYRRIVDFVIKKSKNRFSHYPAFRYKFIAPLTYKQCKNVSFDANTKSAAHLQCLWSTKHRYYIKCICFPSINVNLSELIVVL